MAADYQTITFEVRDHVAYVTLNRPEVYNAFDAAMQEEVRDVWRNLRVDDEARVVVLSAAGDKAFCVGIDRNEPFVALDGGTKFGTSNDFMYDDPGDNLGPKSCDLWKPVIAAVNGIACGGAFYFLAEADIIIAADNATFFDPHVTYGMAAVYEPMKMLAHMPLGEVLRMSLLGAHEQLSAQTAHRIGLVTDVVAPGELQTEAARLAAAIASANPSAIQATLRAIWAANDLSREQANSIAPAILAAGMDLEALSAGGEEFASGARIEPRIR
ncbi:MAG: enoyl-CoA hydratase/isomerase family protein [Acidobacteria bacterium]|nr:enoyl-CoA hydratase/isomerase family protein [Acidobacteriota bacterium]